MAGLHPAIIIACIPASYLVFLQPGQVYTEIEVEHIELEPKRVKCTHKLSVLQATTD